ncbi:uncharacterized protein LOC116775626 [Danaus plexippus]|uniref:uncharacterized protein LOC116775626 n=1 Tax=Danaus plexippus TaxID=13037 RepID=UPI002AB0707A|nr:uncharacterized protein LOC116775626 [Danaus plexippus]
MLVKNVLMELRCRLRSCNVYITTDVDFKKDCNLKICIQSNCILINYYDNERDSLSSIESLTDCSEDESNVSCSIPIHEFCYIIPNSMSCLQIEKNTISFRILTEPKNGGNFYSEFLTPLENKEIKISKLNMNIKESEEVRIVCGNCSNIVSDDFVKFDRILELPTSNLDMSEWFCHGHSHDKGISITPEMLRPNKQDFLYRLTYFVVNNKILSDKINKFNSKRSIYHCNRCLAWLGMKNKETVKLYNSDVKLEYANNNIHVFTHTTSVQNISTDDFIYTIECMIREFNLGLQYTMLCKIVLECTISATNKQYLLIWVMDKELQVLRNSEKQECPDQIVLQSSFLTKILYKIELECNDEVENWLADPTVVNTDISKTMFFYGIEHLKQMSMKVPESFRYTNGYCISFLKV